MSKKKLSKKEEPNVNPELKGFDIKVNSFGEIVTNYDVDKINEFLNRNVDDKKLRHLEDPDQQNIDDEGEKKDENL